MIKFNKKLLFSLLLSLFLCLSFSHSVSAATLGLSPSSGSYSVGDTIKVRVVLASPSQSVNAVSGAISFSSNSLTLSSISKSGSIISLWPVEPSYSNAKGTANMEGIALSGYQGNNGTIVTLSFKAKSAGSASIRFTSSSALANDGQGTEIISGTGQANFSILSKKKSNSENLEATQADSQVNPSKNSPDPDVSSVPIPVFTDYSRDLKEGDYLVVKGLTDSSTDIIVTSDEFLSSGEEGAHESVVVTSNDKGIFAYLSNNRVKNGFYIVTAQARDKDGNLSEKTLPIKINVSPLAVVGSSTAQNKIIEELSIIIPIISLLILLILLVIWGWHHVLHYRRTMRKKFADTENIVSKSFDILGEDVKEEIRIFKKIKALEVLTPEERSFINQFKDDIEQAEKTILGRVKVKKVK